MLPQNFDAEWTDSEIAQQIHNTPFIQTGLLQTN